MNNVPQQALAVLGRLETEALAQLSEDVDEGLVALSGDTLLLVQLLHLLVSARAGQGLKAEREQLGIRDEARSHPESEVTQAIATAGYPEPEPQLVMKALTHSLLPSS